MPDPISVYNINGLGPKLFICTELNSFNIRILADSGSQVTIIPKRFISATQLLELQQTDVQFKAYNGSSVPIMGYIFLDIPLRTPDVLANCKVYVCDNSFTPVMGSPELLRFGNFSVDTQRSLLFIGDLTARIDPITVNQYKELKVNLIRPAMDDMNSQQRVRLYADKEFTIPRSSEKVMFIGGLSRLSNGTYISKSQLLSNQLLVGGAMNNIVSECSKFGVQLLNTGETDHVIRKGDFVCEINKVSRSDIYSCSTNANIIPSGIRLRKILNEMNINSDAPEKYKELFKEVVGRYQHLFALDDEPLGLTNVTEFEVNTGTNAPVAAGIYRTPFHLRSEMNRIIKKNVEDGIMEEISSPWSAPCLLVKKANGSYRLVCDYRKLNSCVDMDCYPLPNIRDSLNHLSKSTVFCSADLMSGFHQIKCNESAKVKLAITTESGQYTWNRMPMGVKNAPPTFQRVMDKVMRGIPANRLLVYLDDLLCHAGSYESCIEVWEEVLKRLNQNNLKIKACKVHALMTSIEFVGYTISAGTLSPTRKKVQALLEMGDPTTVTEAKGLFGLLNYHRSFIPNFAALADPITATYRNSKGRFIWTDDASKAAVQLKGIIANHTLKLHIPDLNNVNLVLETDASSNSIGGCLFFCEI